MASIELEVDEEPAVEKQAAEAKRISHVDGARTHWTANTEVTCCRLPSGIFYIRQHDVLRARSNYYQHLLEIRLLLELAWVGRQITSAQGATQGCGIYYITNWLG